MNNTERTNDQDNIGRLLCLSVELLEAAEDAVCETKAACNVGAALELVRRAAELEIERAEQARKDS